MFKQAEDTYAIDSPTVTVLIAAYNSQAFIERTLNSISAQTFVDFQCIISDDGSDDRTLEICQSVVESDHRFSLLRNTRNLGWIGNVNQLLDQVCSEFFMLMPHDDVLAPEYLECLTEMLRTHSDAIVAFSDMEVIQPNGDSSILSFNLPLPGSSAKERCIHLLGKVLNWWLPYRGLVRINQAGNDLRLRKNLAGEAHADKVWVLDLAMRGEFVRYPQVMYTKFRYQDSVSRLWRHNRRETTASFLSCIKAVLQGPMAFWCKCELIVRLLLLIAGHYRHIFTDLIGLVLRRH